MSVIAHTALTDPDRRRSAFAEKAHRLVADGRPWPEKDRNQRRRRDMDGALIVAGSQSTILTMDNAVF